MHDSEKLERRNVAVIGSGVAGLTAAYVLSRHDRVTLYEADARLGGHAHTHHLTLDSGAEVDVDTGFIVHNDRTYPTLLRLFAELDVATQDSDMSMSIRSDVSGLEYAGAKGIRGLFPTARTLTRPRYWRMLGEVLRFHRCARAVLDTPADEAGAQEPLGEFLEPQRFQPVLRRELHDSARRGGVVVRSHDGRVLPGPLPVHVPRSPRNAHRLRVAHLAHRDRWVGAATSRRWRHTSTRFSSTPPCQQVERTPDGGACVVDGRGDVRYFDAVVVAVHPRQALAMLGDASELETEILGDMPYSVNHAQLHTDESVLPRAENARASWNYLTPADSVDATGVIVTYDMTRLMRLDTVRDRRFLVTLGGKHLVDPSTVLAEMTYEHPVYTPDSVAAQSRLPELGSGTFAFAGAYHGWGFHEDGALSGLRAAERIGGSWDARVGRHHERETVS